jgi:leader peptidase (prepilin peptidase)/N-methyltransferase
MIPRGRDTVAVLAGLAVGGLVAAGLGRSPVGVIASAGAVALLSAAASIDLRERRVPNVLTYSGIVLALTAGALAGALALAALGCLVATGLMGLMYVIGRGRLGMGDVKLAAAVGAAVGPAAVPLFLLTSGIAGAVGALALLAAGRGRHGTMPYAPALVVGALVALIQAGTLVG